MQLTFIRNATLVLDYAGQRLLIDPFFAPKHAFPTFAGIEQNPTVELPDGHTPESIMEGTDLVIVSHLHPDHFDPVAQAQLDKSLPLICQPGDEATIEEIGFSAVTPLTASMEWNGIKITRTEGHHGLGSVEAATGKVMGFVLEAEGEPKVYWAGDTVMCEEVESAISTHQPDVIVTHSGGARWPESEDSDQTVLIIMDAAETLKVAELVPESKIVATHMEALDHCLSTRADLSQQAAAANISDRILIPADGKTLTIN